MNLAELTQTLSGPAWLKTGDIYVVTAVGGYMPIPQASGQTIVGIRIIHIGGKDDASIWLRVTGRLSANEFFQALGTGNDSAVQGRITAIALNEGSTNSHLTLTAERQSW